MALEKLKKRVKNNKKVSSLKEKFIKLFSNSFGFESNVDLSNDVDVLYRRNVVIKNIIFVTNLLYTVILFLLSFNDSKNLILSVLLVPFTFLLNKTLKDMIFRKPDDMTNQTIAMYFASLYMFVSATLCYIKLKNQFTSTVDNETQIVIYGEVGYAMLYVCLLVVSLYQDKKVLSRIYKWLIIAITILNFTVTYNFSDEYGHASEGMFYVFKEVVTSEQFKDIVLRMFVLGLFMGVLYINVSISQYLLEQRKKELNTRKEVESDYVDVVSNIFKLELESFYVTDDDKYEANLVKDMSIHLASYLGLNPDKASEIGTYSMCYMNDNVDTHLLKEIDDKSKQYEVLKRESTKGETIIKREVNKKRIEDIVRKHIQGTVSDDYSEKMKKIYQSEEDQIIGICEVFIILRSFRSYKRPYTKEQTIEILTKDFRQYFDSIIFERFLNFVDKFDDLYTNYGGINGEKDI